jgi:hypothetical protein
MPRSGPLPTCPDVFYGFGYSGGGAVLRPFGGKPA